MLNPNKISEIKIIIDQLLKDIDSLTETELVSPLKWEELFIATSLIKEKISTLKSEQERIYYKNLIEERYVTQNDNSESTPSDIIKEAEKEMTPEANETAFALSQVEVAGISEEDSGEKYIIEADDTINEDDPGEIEFDFSEDFKPLNDVVNHTLPGWMRDIPGPEVDDLHKAVTLNDKLYFIRELFKGDEDQYRLSLQRLNEMENLTEALEYTRNAFAFWDEESNAVYRFYMLLRRRYNG